MPFIRYMLVPFLCVATLTGCNSSNSQTSDTVALTQVPINLIANAYFRDEDGEVSAVGGKIIIDYSQIDESDRNKTEQLSLFWVDSEHQKLADAWLEIPFTKNKQIQIPIGSSIPSSASALLILQRNQIGYAQQGKVIHFHDFTGNALLSGPGGNEKINWKYGEDRANISVQRLSEQGGLCMFDNGLVSVTDMANNVDTYRHEQAGVLESNLKNDTKFTAYQFLCADSPTNEYKLIEDEYGVWTYSTINDAMFYGTLVYDMFLKYLGEPALTEKIRLRVHYGASSNVSAFWDGAYANFSDGYPFVYSTASLDIIAHEVAHGVLNRIGQINYFEQELSNDARTVHEAFADITGALAKYTLSGQVDDWQHGRETAFEGVDFGVRYLDRIKTEYDAIGHYSDYALAGDNYYLRIGMITYPFYIMSQDWGIEKSYRLYIAAAKHCWTASMSLVEAASCIKTQAQAADQDQIIDAFSEVGILLR